MPWADALNTWRCGENMRKRPCQCVHLDAPGLLVGYWQYEKSLETLTLGWLMGTWHDLAETRHLKCFMKPMGPGTETLCGRSRHHFSTCGHMMSYVADGHPLIIFRHICVETWAALQLGLWNPEASLNSNPDAIRRPDCNTKGIAYSTAWHDKVHVSTHLLAVAGCISE